MKGILDLLGSQKGVVVLMALIGATVLTGMHIMAIDRWQEFAMWIVMAYLGVNGAQRITETIARRNKEKD